MSLINLRKAMSQFMKKTQISEKLYQKPHILQDKTECQKYKNLVTAFAKLIPPNFLVLISTKSRTQNLSKANDEVF